jgi:hypothetical protein
MKAFCLFALLSCCATASPVPDTTYRCVCNNVDKGRCETIYIKYSEYTWYVNFYFKETTILKRLNECRVDRTATDPFPNLNLTIGRL